MVTAEELIAADTRSTARGPSIHGSLLVAAVVYGAWVQGAFYANQFAIVKTLVGAALLASFFAVRPRISDILSPASLACVLVALSALASAFAAGDPALARPLVGMYAALAAAVIAVRRLEMPGREILCVSVMVAAAGIAAMGWYGVAFRVAPYALEAQGLLRAASTVTYANGAAALLVPGALLALARATTGSRVAPAAAYGALVGLAATLSRAGLLAFIAGSVALVVIAGWRRVLVASWSPMAGALIALAGLAPSFPSTLPPRPLPAALGLAGGLAVTLAGPRLGMRRAAAAVIVLLAATVLVGGGDLRQAIDRVGASRVAASSEDRAGEWGPALRQGLRHPVLGVGPGLYAGGTVGASRYAHSEPLQVFAEQGAIGLAALLAALVLVARAVLRGRTASWVWAGAAASLTALLVHASMDFVWHIPAVPVVGAVLAGVASPFISEGGTRHA